MIRETMKIIAVDMKSRAESTSDAKTDNEEDVNVTIILATRSNIFAAKFIKIVKFTIRVSSAFVVLKIEGRRAVSSSSAPPMVDSLLDSKSIESEKPRWYECNIYPINILLFRQ